MSLYEALVGARWGELPASLRALYGAEHATSASGRFRVARGTNVLARMAAAIARMPKEAAEVPTTVSIAPTEDGVRWSRRFGDRVFATRQSARDGLLAERVGLLEYRFKLRVDGGKLVFDKAGVALALGPLRLPLPRMLQGDVTGVAWEEGGEIRTEVSIGLPLLGPLVAYDGVLAPPG